MHRHATRSVMPGTRPGIIKVFLISVFLATLILFLSTNLFGQQLTGSLSGTANDSSGAAVPGASVELKNAASGDIRHVVSNGDGFFAIVSVQPGTYSLTVSKAGFTTWEADGVVMNQGDNRNMANIVLKVG